MVPILTSGLGFLLSLMAVRRLLTLPKKKQGRLPSLLNFLVRLGVAVAMGLRASSDPWLTSQHTFTMHR